MHASGQSEIIIEILGKHQNILLFNSNSIPLSSYNGDNKNLRDLWKVLRTIFLCSSDIFWVSSFAFIIGRYANNCFTSGLFLRHVMILPRVTKIGCKVFFPRESVVEASEYNMIDNRYELVGIVFSVRAHQLEVYCSL